MSLTVSPIIGHGRRGSDISSDKTVVASAELVLQRKFIWGAGIECSFVPHLNVDQFVWTQHDRQWRDDFRRAAEIKGLTHLRYALPWHRLEPQRGVFQWEMADERIAFCRELGLELYLDVMHFGVPRWLEQAVGDPEFPEALEDFTETLVVRYRHAVSNWCPCNEPRMLAFFSGDLGFWPPHARRQRGYMPVLSRVIQGVSRSIRAIRRAQPEATVMLCDHVEHYMTRDADMQMEATIRNHRRFLGFDLLMGRVDRQHPLHQWLFDYGLSDLDLAWFRSHPQRPDILGLDYYRSSEWRLEKSPSGLRQRMVENPLGIYGIGSTYYQRYGLPMMVTETSTDGKPINREIWLEKTVGDCRRLRTEGIPMLGYFWWPLFDQIDWDGALTHQVGKIHEVGLFSLRRDADGSLRRHATPMVDQFARFAAAGTEQVGELESIVRPGNVATDEPIGVELPSSANGNGQARGTSPTVSADATTVSTHGGNGAAQRGAGHYGIVVFSHLRWGFVWQRPQQFLSRFARRHRILFVEEPFFDLPAGEEPRFELHQVMPNVCVVAPHFSAPWTKNPALPERLREITKQAIDSYNSDGDFDRPVLWYYSPMDASWSLGHFENRGVVYDCMDELSLFTGAPAALVKNEARLIEHADVVFTGGYELGEKKRQQHDNVHTFGCGVEYAHFAQAADPRTVIPPDIDFMNRPILGWFGVIDERVDYGLVGEVARLRPDWSLAMIGPVVKVDPNLLPHAPNLFWLGGRDYQALPNYCRAFDVCMMPFAMNSSTKFINPTKALEYMATGKPIVGTPIRDVLRQWSDIVRIASDAEEFVAAVDEALAARPEDPRVARGIKLAQASAWDTTVTRLGELITQAISSPAPRSARPIHPIDEMELEYAYRSTQGS